MPRLQQKSAFVKVTFLITFEQHSNLTAFEPPPSRPRRSCPRSTTDQSPRPTKTTIVWKRSHAHPAHASRASVLIRPAIVSTAGVTLLVSTRNAYCHCNRTRAACRSPFSNSSLPGWTPASAGSSRGSKSSIGEPGYFVVDCGSRALWRINLGIIGVNPWMGQRPNSRKNLINSSRGGGGFGGA